MPPSHPQPPRASMWLQHLGTHPPSKLKPPGPPKNALKMLFASKSVRQGIREETEGGTIRNVRRVSQALHSLPSRTTAPNPHIRQEVGTVAGPSVIDTLPDPTPGMCPPLSQRKAFSASTRSAGPSSQSLGMSLLCKTYWPHKAGAATEKANRPYSELCLTVLA